MCRFAIPLSLIWDISDVLQQDASGWTPLMIAASVKDGEKLVDLLLSKGADVNEKSELRQRLHILVGLV
jgi:ankyrin repeat protein